MTIEINTMMAYPIVANQVEKAIHGFQAVKERLIIGDVEGALAAYDEVLLEQIDANLKSLSKG